jgi:hypothetical protein
VTLRELLAALPEASSHRAVHGLIDLLEQWRANADTVEDLYRNVEKYIGKTWFPSDAEHRAVYALWSAFRSQCIAGRGGMTINERLYCFDLFDAWDQAKTDEDRAAIRHKIDLEYP